MGRGLDQDSTEAGLRGGGRRNAQEPLRPGPAVTGSTGQESGYEQGIFRSFSIQSFIAQGSEQVNVLPERQLFAEPWPYHTDQEEDRQILHHGVTNIIIG